MLGGAALAGCAATGAPPAAPVVPAAAPKLERPGRTPNTRFAVNIEMWWKGPPDQRIEEAAALGFPAIEFWRHEDKPLEAMAAALRRHGMAAAQFTALGFGKMINDPAADPQRFVNAIERACAIADLFPDCHMFTVVAGDNIPGLSKERMHAAVVDKVKRVVPLLERHKKTVIIEPMNPYNHPGHCLYGSADGIALCEAIGSEYVKLCWDLFHMQRFEGNLIDGLRRGRAHIAYLQLADSPDRHEPGTGEVNYTPVFKALKEIGYQGLVGLECVPQGGDARRAAERVYAADVW